MAKKKSKPDFTKPKIKKSDKSYDKSGIFNLQEEPDFKENLTSDEIYVEKDGTVVVTGNLSAQDAEYEGLPVVVIAGRPNVGKSTLFNRFLHKRIAITNDRPGVTRDPVEATAILNGKPVHLVDTGGYKLTRDIGTKEAELDDYVVERSLDMIEKADVAVLLLDSAEITGEDEEFILKMRPYRQKLIAAVNKN